MINSRYPVFWGAAIVIFLAKIINFHNANTQGFWVEVSSQVETGELNMRLRFRSSNFSISRAFHRHQHWPHPLASVGHIQCVACFKGFFPFNRPFFSKGIWKIWRYKRKTIQVRAKAGLPQLFDADDLPNPIYDPHYVHVLTDAEQKDLHRRKYLQPPNVLSIPHSIILEQKKFQHSQTWYRAHGTETHRVN